MATREECGKEVDGRFKRGLIEFSEANWTESEDGYKCIRETIEGHHRCFWHADNCPDPEEIQRELDAPERIDGADFTGCDFKKGPEIDFSGCSLCGADFTGSVLENVIFGSQSVEERTLDTALLDATLRANIISDVDFTEAQMGGCEISPHDHDTLTVSYTIFDDASLTDAHLEGLSLDNCSFSGTTMSNLTCRHSKFQSLQTFEPQSIVRPEFTDVDFIGVDFTGFDSIKRGQMRNSTFDQCFFQSIRIDGVDFSKSVFRHCIWSNVTCPDEEPTEFNGATLVNCVFDAGRLLSITFDNAVLVAVSFTETPFDDVEYVSFKNSSLLGVDLSVGRTESLELSKVKPALPEEDIPGETGDAEYQTWVSCVYARHAVQNHQVDPADKGQTILEELPAEVQDDIDAFSNSLTANLPLVATDLPNSDPSTGDQVKVPSLRDTEIANWPTIVVTGAEQRSTLEGLTIEGAVLHRTIVNQITFHDCRIENTSWKDTTLSEVEFKETEFVEGDFESVTGFSVSFPRTTFERVDATDNTIFGTNDSWLRTVVPWRTEPYTRKLKTEVEASIKDSTEAAIAYQDASRQYKQLEILFSENNATERAADYYYRCQDARRKHNKAEGSRLKSGWGLFKHFIYGYGVKPSRVASSIFGVWLVFACFYLFVPLKPDGSHVDLAASLSGFGTIQEIFINRLYFSIITLTSVGFGDLHPVTFWGKVLAGIQGLVGMVLVVLLGYVLGNKEAW